MLPAALKVKAVEAKYGNVREIAALFGGAESLKAAIDELRLCCIPRRGFMAKRKTSSETPITTAQRLGSVIKSARDIMRKDKGLNGELDRLPQLTWILF